MRIPPGAPSLSEKETPMRKLPRNRRSSLLLALAVLVLALTACGGGEEATPAEPPAATTEAPPATTEAPPATTEAPPATTEAPPAEPVTLKVALDWFPNPDHVSLYYALKNGFWDDKALTVNLKTPSDPSAGLKLVATNRFDLAVYYQGDMFFAAEQGLPVIAVGALIPEPLNSMIALADSKVQGPDSIKGATIGVAGLPFDDAILKTLRQQQGLGEGAVKKVNVGFNLVPALLTKKADAVIGAYWNIEGNQIKLKTGNDPVIIKLDQIGVPTYDELLIVANKDRLASDAAYADAVKRFLAGLVEAAPAAQADVPGAVQLMKENSDYKANEIDVMVPPTLDALTPASGNVGCFNLDAWNAFGQWMVDNKLLKTPIDTSTIATNDYLPGC